MPPTRRNLDSRDMKASYVVSDENGYYDSQNIISVFDKNIGKHVLSCVLHHSRNHEGGKGLTLCSSRSEDGGKTWSALAPIERPETEVDCAAYNVDIGDGSQKDARQSHDGYQLLVGDRIYLFYGWNIGSQPPIGDMIPRTDMQLDEGFWMRWSDNYGVTFSGGRVLIPVRRTEIDFNNPWGGKTMGAFCCDKPTIIDGMVYFAFQKTVDGNGESYGSEVFFMRSVDLLSLHAEGRSEEASWETLPHGDHGLQTQRGLLLGEEPHVIQIQGPRLMCVWRTELGFLDTRFSDNYGETWTDGAIPSPLTYSPPSSPSVTQTNETNNTSKRMIQSVPGAVTRNTDLVKDSARYLESEEHQRLVLDNHDVVRNVRGAFTPHKLRDGSIVLLYYNNGHTDKLGYVGRLLVWVTLGHLDTQTGQLAWAQPEVAIWWDGIQLDDRDDWNEDWAIVDGAGYHDIQELDDGRVVFVESNKLTVRYHEIDQKTIQFLKTQLRGETQLTIDDYEQESVFVWNKSDGFSRKRCPVLPDLRSGAGFSIVIWIDMSAITDGTTTLLLDGMSTVSGSLDEEDADDIQKGFTIEMVSGKIKLFVTDGFGVNFEYTIEKLDSEHLKRHYGLDNKVLKLVFVLDGGPKVCSCVLNKKLYNPAPSGWKFLPREFGEIGGSNLRVGDKSVEKVLVLDRALMTSECMEICK